jgi:hypothetical protein
MSKLKCLCGHIIVDQTDNIRHKGYILPDTLLYNVSISFTDIIDSLIDAIKSNKRLEWIKKHFEVPPYPTNIKDSSMIHDLVSDTLIDSIQDIFECENCGRIAIQVGQSDHFKFFSPDSENTKGILYPKK